MTNKSVHFSASLSNEKLTVWTWFGIRLTYILDYKNHRCSADASTIAVAIKYECNLYRPWIFLSFNFSVSFPHPYLVVLLILLVLKPVLKPQFHSQFRCTRTKNGWKREYLQLRMWEKKNFSSHLTNAILFSIYFTPVVQCTLLSFFW